MKDFSTFLIYLAVMAGVTYLIRMLPLVLFRRKIESRFIGAPLYAVCGAYGYDRARGFLVDGGIYPVALRLYRRRSARVL